jgi:hypothetical protein
MKILHSTFLIQSGKFPRSVEWERRFAEVNRAALAVVWPPEANSFTLYDEVGKKRGKGNGVKPIKNACMSHLENAGWKMQTRVAIPGTKRPGPVDATYDIGGRLLCVEWETGNISSSHRSLNKICVGMLAGVFLGGILILPTRAMYKYLTDRVGNYEEIEPYFPLWRSLVVTEGVLVVIGIEHDGVSRDVPRILKGTDGRALQ